MVIDVSFKTNEEMFVEVKWLFFDVGSTIVDEHIAYEHRLREIADLAGTTYEKVYNSAIELYKQNKKGDLVMIGDRIDNNIIPANLLGMHTIWIKQGFGQYWNITEDIERADYIANSLTEICNIL